jgi:DNA (cytosine-5)-methyltransferase 1
MASLQKRGDTYSCIFYWQKKRQWLSLGSVSEKEAEAKAAQVDYLLMRLKQAVTGEYWERHKVSKKARKEIISRLALKAPLGGLTDDLRPWRTVRDAIGDIQTVALGKTDPFDPNHFLNPGARSYKGHTGSPWDEPAKTLKAGDHGVPGGENTLDLGDGSVRYFSPREAARIQTFPDDFRITGAWTEQMRQMGNAVPVELAHVVAGDIARHLSHV